MRKRTRMSRRWTVAGLVLVTVAAWAGVARAAAVSTAPTITAGPSGVTASSTASFTFRANRPSTFICTLDDGEGRTCGSGISYANLADGGHTFRVVARAPGTADSDAATRRWTVDHTAPTVTLTFPVNGSVLNQAGLTPGCATTATADVCGTVTDPSGVAGLRIWINGDQLTVK